MADEDAVKTAVPDKLSPNDMKVQIPSKMVLVGQSMSG